MKDEERKREGLGVCRVCGGELVESFIPLAVGGIKDGYFCSGCGIKYSFIPDEYSLPPKGAK